MNDHVFLRRHLEARLGETWPSSLALPRSRLAERLRPGGGAKRGVRVVDYPTSARRTAVRTASSRGSPPTCGPMRFVT